MTDSGEEPPRKARVAFSLTAYLVLAGHVPTLVALVAASVFGSRQIMNMTSLDEAPIRLVVAMVPITLVMAFGYYGPVYAVVRNNAKPIAPPVTETQDVEPADDPDAR